MRRWLFLIALGAAGAFLFRYFAFEGIYLASGSMEPTLPEGTHIMANKFYFLTKKPKRGQIVMFDSPLGDDKGLVKRVIAIEGDEIELKEKKVYLNGKKLEENYVLFKKPDILFKGDTLPMVKVPDGYIFVMGDNRDFSKDSRDWKSKSGEWTPFLPLSLVTGLVQDVP